MVNEIYQLLAIWKTIHLISHKPNQKLGFMKELTYLKAATVQCIHLIDRNKFDLLI